MKLPIFKTLVPIGVSFFLMGCSHTVDFRSSHFAVPHVADEQWQGQVAFSSAQPTEITLIADKESNPPDRTIDINDDTSEEGFFETLFVLDTFGLETDLTLFPQVELYLYGTSNFGLRWQFLGHGNGAGKWVASIQGAYGTWNDESGTEAELDFADTQVKYGKEYTYHVYKYIAVVGAKYRFSDLRLTKAISTDNTVAYGFSVMLY